IAVEAGADHVLPGVAAAARERDHVVAGQQLAGEIPAAVHAQRLVAREQRGVGERRGGIERLRTHVPARGDDRMQFERAAQAGVACGAAVNALAWFTQVPAPPSARVATGTVPYAGSIQYPADCHTL